MGIHGLREVLAANQTVALLIVDSMGAWQQYAAPFPRSTAPMLREAWRALVSLQREFCIPVVVTCHDAPASGSSAAASLIRSAGLANHLRQLIVQATTLPIKDCASWSWSRNFTVFPVGKH